MNQRIQFKIDSDIEAVPLAGVSIKAVCNHLCLSENLAAQVELCAVEMLNNVVLHGFDNEKGHPILIALEVSDKKLLVSIEDRAEPMPELGNPVLEYDPMDVANFPEHGYGRFLVDQIMDEVTYHSQNETNYLIMTKTLSEEHQDAAHQ